MKTTQTTGQQTTDHGTASHTPGPWQAVQLKPNEIAGAEWAIEANRKGIGADLVGLCYRQRENGSANASLIAAAPELLAACEAAVKYLEAHRPQGKIREIFTALNEHENGTLKPLRAAIAKAKGQA